MDLRAKNLPRAEEEFRKLLKEDWADTAALSGLVETYRKEGEFERALSLLPESLDRHPASQMTRALLADTALQAGKRDLAIALYRDLLAIWPRSPQIYMGLAAAYYSKGDLSRAAENIRQALSYSPQDGASLALLGNVLAGSGNWREAITTFHRALALEPGNPAAMNDLAYLSAETGGSLDEAEKLAQKAATTAPNNRNFSDTLRWIYLKSYSTENALQIFQQLAKQYPEKAVYRYHLGMALMTKHERIAATAELTAALKDNASPTVRQKIEAALRLIIVSGVVFGVYLKGLFRFYRAPRRSEKPPKAKSRAAGTA